MGVKGSKLSRGVSFGNHMKRLRSDSSSSSSSLGSRRGYVPVAVGVDQETRRFLVHTTALSNAEFMEFLWRSAEEYGFSNEGILRIPYDPNAFEEWMIRNTPKQRLFRIQPTNTAS